jgi:DNA polymerase-3 subunit gamma/tau
VLEVEPVLRKASQPQLVLETLLVRCALLDRTVSLEELIRRLPEAGGASPLAGPPASPPTVPSRATVARGPMRAEAPVVVPSEARDPHVAPSAARPTAGRGAPAVAAPALAPAPAVAPRPTAARHLTAMEEPPHPADGEAESGPPLDVEVRNAPPPVADLPDATRVAEGWDGVVAAVRANGHAMLATLLGGAFPSAVAASGTLTLEVTDPATIEGIERRSADVLAAIATRWPAITKVAVRAAGAAPSPKGRITHDTVREEHIASLRRRDPVLGAAIDALDLEPLD